LVVLHHFNWETRYRQREECEKRIRISRRATILGTKNERHIRIIQDVGREREREMRPM